MVGLAGGFVSRREDSVRTVGNSSVAVEREEGMSSGAVRISTNSFLTGEEDIFVWMFRGSRNGL